MKLTSLSIKSAALAQSLVKTVRAYQATFGGMQTKFLVTVATSYHEIT